MAIFKANYVKRGKTAKDLAKASVRYIQHRRGTDGQTITRTLFNTDGPMARHEAYRMIDDAQKGSFFYALCCHPIPHGRTTTTTWICAISRIRPCRPWRSA